MATRTISVAGGNWDAVGTWDEGVVPVAGDAVVARSSGSGNLTVNVPSACASIILTNYTGTLTFNSTLTLTSTCTFVSGMTIAGTAGTLIHSGGSSTLTSGGKTLTCALTVSGDGSVYTLGDNWTVNGLTSIGSTSSTVINGNKITCVGGLSVLATGGGSGTAKLEITGGTWSHVSTGPLRNNVDLAGNVTVGGTVRYGTGTLRHVFGTITTAGSTLVLASGSSTVTLDVGAVGWNNVSLSTDYTVSLPSNLVWSGTLTLSPSASVTFSGVGKPNGTGAVTIGSAATITLNNTGGLVTTGTMTLPNAACTFAGSAGFSVGTLTTAPLTASRIHTLTFGNTYTVTTSLANVGATAAIRQALKSGTPGSKVAFTLTPGATVSLLYCDPTDVDSSAGAPVTSINGVITTTLNWNNTITTPVTPAGGGGGRSYHMGI